LAVESYDMAAAVRAQLDKILSSRSFSGADRATGFLRFVVDKTLAGEADQLKEYVLAVEALGRKPSFDPRIDPIVRVEAGRLRGRLEEYYQTEGSGDDLLITLPKGGYVPTFERREQRSQGRCALSPPAPDDVGNYVGDSLTRGGLVCVSTPCARSGVDRAAANH
jgi:hypothetical protein